MSFTGDSPQYVQTSLAGALSLGLQSGRFLRNAGCGCLNLLLTYGNGCKASCSYCGLAHNRIKDSGDTFIRVPWPTYSLNQILEQMQARRHPFKRVCVSMITHGHAVEDTCVIVDRVTRETGLPVSGLLSPTVMKGRPDLEKMRSAGMERAGIAVDAATEALFIKHRGQGVGGPHQWGKYWQTIAEAVDVFGPYMVGVHMIVGLGETEQEMVATIARAQEMGAVTHLFSFFPEAGSLMQDCPQPELDVYRRIQLARYLINNGLININAMQFSEAGKILDFGIDIEPYVEAGEPFMTSGCPDEHGKVACTRPFGNERASEPMRNYPFPPDNQDIKIIKSQIGEGAEVCGRA
ncbi:MAG TPA: radical SAM protein [Syntrophomonas sp.]|nr:radical SAM protein [Syntrophomonas sp.]